MERMIPFILAFSLVAPARSAGITGQSPRTNAVQIVGNAISIMPPAWQHSIGQFLDSPDFSAAQLNEALRTLNAQSPWSPPPAVRNAAASTQPRAVLGGARALANPIVAAQKLSELSLVLSPYLGSGCQTLIDAAKQARADLANEKRQIVEASLQSSARALGLSAELADIDVPAGGSIASSESTPPKKMPKEGALQPAPTKGVVNHKSGKDLLVLAPELGPRVAALEKEISDNPELQKAVRTNPALRALQTQTLTRLRHVSFTFKMRDASYTHDYALAGAFPSRATEIAIKKAEELLRIFNSGEKLPFRPLPRTGETETELLDRQKTFIKKLTENPYPMYLDMRSRLADQGIEASFPELGPVAKYLALKLENDPEVRTLCAENPALWNMRAIAMDYLNDAAQPKEGPPFPYMPTLEAIQRAVEFFDVHQRALDPKRSPALYHSARYEYYGHFLKGQAPDHIIMPTIVGLGATDILKIRGVPIGLIGVNTDITWVDGFYQTPYEFWVHDINHSRRMYQFFQEKANASGRTIAEFAAESDRFIRERLLPLIIVKKSDDEVVKNKKRLLKVLLFEILHEDALAAAPDVVRTAVLRPPNLITPFERIDGAVVSYVMEPGATTLAYVFRKLAHDFYDMPGARLDNIVGSAFRTRENIIEAAETLMRALEAPFNHEVLAYFVSTDVGFPKDFKSTIAKDIQRRPGETIALDQEVGAGKENVRSIVAKAFHAAWQKNSGYSRRWKPARASFKDGRGVNDDFRIQSAEELRQYFAENAIPESMRKYYSFQVDPKSRLRTLYEDIQHLPNQYLAPNNQFENLQGASAAVDLIEGIAEDKLHFSNVSEATQWLTEACRKLHLGWLRRNQSWVKDYPEYNRPWDELGAGKQLNGVTLLKIALETATQVNPNAMERTQKAVLLEALRRLEVHIDRKRSAEVRATVAGERIHENWRAHSKYTDRWKPASARLDDGTRVTSDETLDAYFAERQIPGEFRPFIAFKPDPTTGILGLYEDLKNLPFIYLAENHQEENILSGRYAVDLVDRVWAKKLIFKNRADAQRWLFAAASSVHEAVLKRNINGAKDNPVYNRPWSELPAENKKQDLALIRIAFEARFKLQPEQMPEAQQRLISIAIKKIERELR